MDGQKFLNLCIEKISKYMGVAKENVLVVWSCKVLQNNKALLGISGSNAYYELTYNGDKKELYMDVYSKDNNVAFKNIE
ncbi:DUF6275 family protein [Ligilactobacillus faecis]|uniref:DUF6275 family protein n=1 Tax=Ligilactobacillus faecis TaxID=762833 RepID=UPI002468F5FA|nr:DUF6275 family protein [Ligilactobacillus faecis]WGN89783.1 DUF6275 family protein [Ligilactobacillus faecis]